MKEIKELVEWLNRENTLKLKSLQNTPDWFKHCGLITNGKPSWKNLKL